MTRESSPTLLQTGREAVLEQDLEDVALQLLKERDAREALQRLYAKEQVRVVHQSLPTLFVAPFRRLRLLPFPRALT